MRNEERGSLRPPVEGVPTPGHSLNSVLISVVQRNRTNRNEIYNQESTHVIMEAKKPHVRKLTSREGQQCGVKAREPQS